MDIACAGPPRRGGPYLRVGELLVDLNLRRLLADGDCVDLPPRVFDLLELLMREPHRLHERGTLLERVWAGVIVEDANLSQSIWLLRRALGAERRHWIRTVCKRGYVFEPPHPVEVVDEVTPDRLLSPAFLAVRPADDGRIRRPLVLAGLLVALCLALLIVSRDRVLDALAAGGGRQDGGEGVAAVPP